MVMRVHKPGECINVYIAMLMIIYAGNYCNFRHIFVKVELNVMLIVGIMCYKLCFVYEKSSWCIRHLFVNDWLRSLGALYQSRDWLGRSSPV